MADLSETPLEYPQGIYQLERDDKALGGPPNLATKDGTLNIPNQQLAKRTAWIKAKLSELLEATTAEAIRDLLKTVDGAGSGLDADTLDGKHASAFILLSDLLERMKMVDGHGSGLDADTLDGRQAAEFVSKDGDTVSGNLSIGGILYLQNGPTTPSQATRRDYVDQVVGGRVSKSGDSMSGSLYVQGTVFSEGREVLVWSDTSFAKDTVVLARYDGSVEKFYGAETDGDTLQPCAGNGNENTGPIGIGLWVCLGHAKQNNGSFSAADRTTLWFRKN